MSYTPKVWAAGNDITATDLNHLEEGVEEAHAALVPTGVIIEFGGDAAPTGWLLCNGAPVSRTTYAALYAVIGTKYNGSTNNTAASGTQFNVPDKRGRLSMGLLATDTDFHEIGHAAGSKSAVVLNHTHPVSHRNTDYDGVPLSGGAIPLLDPVSYGYNLNSGNPNTVGVTNTGNQNLPPYVTSNYIIKT